MLKKVARKLSLQKLVYITLFLGACVLARWLGVECLPCLLESLKMLP